MAVMYAALHGVNIPGGLWLDEASVRSALQRLPPTMTFLRSVGRPDSILIGANDMATEEDVRRAVTAAIGRPCVALSTTLASRIVDGALTALRALGPPVVPPYRIAFDGAEWEWCLVLTSDALPPGRPEHTWLFDPKPHVVAVTPLEHRALLLRKRRANAHRTRITLGDRLLVPWRTVLEANGVIVACLTSRTLNRVQEVVTASVQFERASR